jgi:hypothetical protein
MRSIPRTAVLLALLIPLLQSIPHPALAAEPDKPWRVAYDHCQTLSNDGDYTGALDACEQAYALNPDPGILAYIAQIQTALLHPVQAREALERYLRSGTLDSADRKTAEAQIRYLDTQITTLLVDTPLEGAQLRVDDQLIDTRALARGVPLPVGAHRVTLHAKGATFSRFIVLRSGERTRLELPGSGSISLSCAVPGTRFFIDDQEVDAAQASRGVPRAAGSHRILFKAETTSWLDRRVMVTPDERVTIVCTTPQPGAVQSAMNPRGYWVAGAGLALGVAALTTAIYNGSEYKRWQTANDDLRDRLQREELSLTEGAYRAQETGELMESIKTRRNVALGLGIGSALVTATGVALLFADSATSAHSGVSSWLRKVAAGLTVNGVPTSGEVAWRAVW